MTAPVELIRVCYSEGPLFCKSTISTSPKPNLKADPNPNRNHITNPSLTQTLAL